MSCASKPSSKPDQAGNHRGDLQVACDVPATSELEHVVGGLEVVCEGSFQDLQLHSPHIQDFGVAWRLNLNLYNAFHFDSLTQGSRAREWLSTSAWLGGGALPLTFVIPCDVHANLLCNVSHLCSAWAAHGRLRAAAAACQSLSALPRGGRSVGLIRTQQSSCQLVRKSITNASSADVGVLVVHVAFET